MQYQITDPDTIASVRNGRHPSLVLLHYDRASLRVVDLLVIHKSWITESAVLPRPPLCPPARRAGWQGCTFALDRIPSTARVHVVIQGRPLHRSLIADTWRTAHAITEASSSSRSWTSDVLLVIDRLRAQFTLEDVYRFEPHLSRLHMRNRHIRPKIRQQLQIARDLGLIRFLGQGRYAKV